MDTLPNREELVAALSHNREELSQVFRVPTPIGDCEVGLDKRNTYRLAQELGIPTPRHALSGKYRPTLAARQPCAAFCA